MKVKIVGLIIEEENQDTLYNSMFIDSRFKNYLIPLEATYKVTTEEEIPENLQTIIETFNDDDTFELTTRFSDTLSSLTEVANKSMNILEIVSYILLGFSILLFWLFITMSINSSKRKIGILSSLGVKMLDCISIFILESFWLGFLSIILSNVLAISLITFGNTYISKNVGFLVSIFSYNSNVIHYILFAVIFSIVISLIIPIVRITKMKPAMTTKQD